MNRTVTFFGALCVTGGLFLTVALDAGQQARGGVPAPRAVQTMTPAPAGPLPPMPLNGPLARSRDIVAAVYEFAARHPEVLQYVPCYCGCERVGHTANHSCFVKSRAADGRVTEWDSHGLGCAVCLDVARDAMNLFNAGGKPAAIRDAIDKKYGPHFPSATPTPRPAR